MGHENATHPLNVVDALLYRIKRKPEGRRTEAERKLLAVDLLIAEVHNGGFDQYFFNSSGNDAEVALAGLKEMGAAATATLLERAMAVFPGGKPPTDRFKRQEVMEQIANPS